jgi:biopolymer transport protein ExbD
MKVRGFQRKPPRVEMMPLIDMVFLLLVVFIYAMLSMAVHRGLPVNLPTSAQVQPEKDILLSVTVRADGALFLDKTPVGLEDLDTALRHEADGNPETGVLLFADRELSYQRLFAVMDRIRRAGLSRISLQGELENQP